MGWASLIGQRLPLVNSHRPIGRSATSLATLWSYGRPVRRLLTVSILIPRTREMSVLSWSF